MRRRYRVINGELVDITGQAPVPRERGVMIQRDIEPYESIITGEKITSRSRHREHLRQHGMQEVGDQIPEFLKEKYERNGIEPVWGRDGRRVR